MKCERRDYALTESARQMLVEPNKVICICCHCRAQGITHLEHTPQCCFHKKREYCIRRESREWWVVVAAHLQSRPIVAKFRVKRHAELFLSTLEKP